MNNNSGTVRTSKVITIAGAFIAFLIGSGFATGQEVLQYFSSYGYWGIAGAILTLFLLIYVGVSFLKVGEKEKFKKGSDIYTYYCGNALGKFFDYFSTLFCFLSFTVMVSGAGATLNQHYGWPVFVGGILISILALFTVIMGLNRIVEIIGKIGPAIVVISIVLGVVSILSNYQNLAPEYVSTQLAAVAERGDLLTASSNWVFASFSYVGFCMLWLAAFLAAAGANTLSQKEAALGGFFGAFGFSLAVVVVALGLLACIDIVAGSQIPMLYLAGNIHPGLASIFSIVIMMGIYTTSVPLLWNVSARFTQDGSAQFKGLTAVLAVIGMVIGLYLPFDRLVNIVYVINGYVGVILLLIMFIRSVKAISKRKSEEQHAHTPT